MQIVEKRIDEIRPYEKNPRKNDAAVKYVAESIKEFGFKVPIITDRNGVIVAGHTRYKAAKELGLEVVPTIVADDLTDAQIKAFRLADNKVAEVAEWDYDLLNQELNDLMEQLDMESFGFDFEDITDDDPDAYEDDYNVDDNISKETYTKPGDVYLLGNHRLMCGDSTNEADVKKLMNEERADLLFTDPPYNVAIENSQGMTIENDNMDNDSFLLFLTQAFENAEESLKEGGAFYIWYASRVHMQFETALNNAGMSVREQIIWVKNSFTFGRQDYKWKHEPCLYGWKDGAPHYFIDEYNHPTTIEEEIDLENMKKEDMKRILAQMLKDQEKTPTTIIHQDKPLKNDLHPTMKPIKLCAELIRHSAKKGELVLDLFGGSGSTMIACEELGRRANLMEFDPVYADVIVKRFIALKESKDNCYLIRDGEKTPLEKISFFE